MEDMAKTLLDHPYFKDENGEIVLVQAPNAPMLVFFVAFVASRVITEGYWHQFASGAALGALLVWGLVELTRGVNGFRKTLGALALIATLFASLTGFTR